MRSSMIKLVAAGLGAAVTVFACSSKDTTLTPVDAGTDSATVEEETITIGVNLALSGTLAAFGKAEQDATRVAQNQINSLGGVLGKKIKFEIVDDRTDTATSKANFEGFFGRKLPVVLGPTGSGQAPDGQKLAAAAFFPLISPSASTPVTQAAEPAKERFFFRTAPSHGLQAKAIAIRLFKGFKGATSPADAGADAADSGGGGGAPTGCRSVAILNQDDAYGNPIAAGITETMKALGGDVVATIKVPAEPKANYDAEAAQVVAAKADCQVVAAFPAIGAVYMRSFKKAIASDTSRDWSSYVSIGSNGLKAEDTLVKGRENAADPNSPTSPEGMYIMNFDLSPKTSQANEFKNIYLTTVQADPAADLPGYSANQYDAAILAALAIQKAGTLTDGKKIRDALFEVSRPPGAAFTPSKLSDALVALRGGADIDYDGASGPVDFDDFGEVLANFVVFKVVGGKFVQVADAGLTPDELK